MTWVIFFFKLRFIHHHWSMVC